MSRGTQSPRAELLAALMRELRQVHGLGASFFRAAAARSGMTVTDLQVIDLLESAGPMTAGQLADLTGLTTGAITGLLNRLEEAGRVRRERDPNDGRRVIVRLAPGADDMPKISAIFSSLGTGWDDLASHYDDERIAFLLEFLERCNALSQQEIVQLREAPPVEGGIFSAPLGDVESGQLVVSLGTSQLTVRANAAMADLYQARFEGPLPDVKAREGVVTIRYPRRLLGLGGGQGAAKATLNAAIPWRIVVQGKASAVTADLGRLDLTGLEVKGVFSMIRLELPAPSGVVPLRISGAASDVTIRRPVGVAARVHLKGWAAALVFDDQTFSAVGKDVRLHSPDYEATAPCYDIDVTGAASMVTITSG